MHHTNNSFVRRNWRNIMAMVTYATDSLAVLGCGITVWYLLLQFYSGPILSFDAALRLTAYFWIVLSFFALILGLYRQAYPVNANSQYLMAAKAYVYGIPIILALFYFLHYITIPRSYIALFLLLLPLHYRLGRALLSVIDKLLQRTGLGVRNTLVVVENGKSESSLHQFRTYPSMGYSIKGVIVYSSNGSELNPDLIGFEDMPYYPVHNLSHIIQREGIDRVFIPSTSFVVNGFHDIVEQCRHHNTTLKVISPEATRLLRLARVYDVAGITLYSPPRRRIELMKKVLKRIFDLVGAFILLVLLSPVFLLTSLAIFLETGRPVYYTQRRTSTKGGESFNFIKFRSMIQGAENLREHLSHMNEADGAMFKMKNDPRLTRVGRFIRKFSIDELPQLINVLVGNMSLVGPRPLPISDIDMMDVDDDFWDSIRDRAKVKPGITGLWQISGRSDLDFTDMVLLDLYYIEHQSALFDLEILFETIPAVFFSRGAY